MRSDMQLFFLSFFKVRFVAPHSAFGIRPAPPGSRELTDVRWCRIPTPHSRPRESDPPPPLTGLSFFKSLEEQVRGSRAERSGRRELFWLRNAAGPLLPGFQLPPAPGSPLRVGHTIPGPTGQPRRGEDRAGSRPREPARRCGACWRPGRGKQSERTEAFFILQPAPSRRRLAASAAPSLLIPRPAARRATSKPKLGPPPSLTPAGPRPAPGGPAGGGPPARSLRHASALYPSGRAPPPLPPAGAPGAGAPGAAAPAAPFRPSPATHGGGLAAF